MSGAKQRLAAKPSEAPTLRERVKTARALLSTAEVELERALARVESAPRAAKVTIGQSLKTAVTKLRDAQLELTELERTASRK